MEKLTHQLAFSGNIGAGSTSVANTLINYFIDDIFIHYINITYYEVYQATSLPSNETSLVIMDYAKNNYNPSTKIPGFNNGYNTTRLVTIIYKNTYNKQPFNQTIFAGDNFYYAFNFVCGAPATATISCSGQLNIVYSLVKR